MRFVSVFLLLFAWQMLGTEAPPSSTIQGTVYDASHAPVAGATIQIAATAGSFEVSTFSDQNGQFAMAAPGGTYTMNIASPGFNGTSRVIDVRDDMPRLEVTLEITPVRDIVNVVERPGYVAETTSSATRTLTPLQDVPQSITVVSRELMRDQMMMSMADVVRYVPGVSSHQGENNRDQLIIRGNSTSADFFVNGVRDDVQYYRDLYNLESVEALKGPNAMIFGRGGGGGVINRVTKEAGYTPLREVTIQGGSFGNKRATADFDQPVNDKVALRLNAMYENSDSFRRYVGLDRYGVAPALSWLVSERTKLTVSYEHFHDARVADRGVSSYLGRPLNVDPSFYIGNPTDAHVFADVDLGSVSFEHQIGRLNIRDRAMFGGYDRGYQNYVPGAVTSDGSQIAISAYNNATKRVNLFNQTDVTYTTLTGRVRHTLLGGIEAGRQLTDNFRNTGYFNGTATSITIPLTNTILSTPAAFRQSATDADNHLRTNVGATYMQDQVELSRHVQLIGGIRLDHFDLQYFNNRTGDRLRRIDNLVSPRAGIVIKPVAAVSLYGNYSVSYLPSSGDQFSSLTTITQQVKPEKFSNFESGIKWDLARKLSLTTAVYRLDRTNTRSTDPNDPTRIVQTGRQRTNGFEIGATGSVTRFWRIAGGYSYQDAFVTGATTSARAGAQVAQVPHNTFSLWNNLQAMKRLGAGLGIVDRSDMYAAIDNTVVLPRYTRADAAVYYSITERTRLQVNVENLFDRKYYANADSNTNISFGSPRAIRAGLVVRF